jgi:hypothetical protein
LPIKTTRKIELSTPESAKFCYSIKALRPPHLYFRARLGNDVLELHPNDRYIEIDRAACVYREPPAE